MICSLVEWKTTKMDLGEIIIHIPGATLLIVTLHLLLHHLLLLSILLWPLLLILPTVVGDLSANWRRGRVCRPRVCCERCCGKMGSSSC